MEGISGASFVLKGQDYTFSAPAGMDYGFTAEMGGQAVDVEDNGDGTIHGARRYRQSGDLCL